jgi:hypothetical protein
MYILGLAVKESGNFRETSRKFQRNFKGISVTDNNGDTYRY